MNLEQGRRPIVLVVDDTADDLRSTLKLRLADQVAVTVLHPSDVELEDLMRTDLVLMDYKLDTWPERDNQTSVAFDIRSGLALGTVFREIADEKAPDQLIAIALHTAHLLEASGRIRPPHSNHVVARLLHQVLPYPSFLWDVHWVAARLRMKVEDLERLIDSEVGLARDLQERMYTGILNEFLGKRWWRTAIEDYVWELGRGASGNPNHFGDRLRERAGVELELIDISDPVVCLNPNFEPVETASPHDAVRLRPDYWPSFADAAWMKINTLVDDPTLRAMVEPVDQYRLPSDE